MRVRSLNDLSNRKGSYKICIGTITIIPPIQKKPHFLYLKGETDFPTRIHAVNSFLKKVIKFC